MPRAMQFRRSRLVGALATPLLTAMLLAACGGSSGSTATVSKSASKSASTRPATARGATGSFAATYRGGAAPRTSSITSCLRAHGFTAPAGAGGGAGRPPSGTGGSRSTGGPGGPNNSKLSAAMRACGVNFGARYTPASAARRAAVNRFASCMAAAGDKLPTPNFSGNGAIFPASAEKGAKFKTAYAKCRSLASATT